MELRQKNKLVFWIGVLFLILFQARSEAADGPQNTGRLFLNRTGGSKISALLQIDKKLRLRNDDFFKLIQIRNRGDVCSRKPAKFIVNEETLTGSTTFECPHSVHQLTISLVSPEDLPPAFTLGVQTPFDHAVLDSKFFEGKFDLGEKLWFFRAGLSFGFAGNEIISRPYAFSFGGLHRLPWGTWWWLVIASVLISGVSKLGRLIVLFLGITVSLGLAFFILSKEASLRLLSAPYVDTAILVLTPLVSALGLFKKEKQRNIFALPLLIIFFVVSGLEWAIVLRWLEGNTRVLLSDSIIGFYLGLGTSTLALGAIFMWGQLKLTRVFSVLSFLRILIVSFALYVGISMWFQLN